MSGRGKVGKGLGKTGGKKQRLAEFEWTPGQNVFDIAYVHNDDCETHIYTVPESKMDPVLMHIFKDGGTKKFMWDLGQEDTLEGLFETLTQKQFDKLTSKEEDDDEGEEGEEEDDEEEDDEEEEIDDRTQVIDHIRDWIASLPDKFSEPPGVPVNILAKFGICESG